MKFLLKKLVPLENVKCKTSSDVTGSQKPPKMHKNKIMSHKVSRSQGLKVSRSQGLKVSRSQGLRVSGSQGHKVSRCQSLKVPWSQGPKV